MVFYRKYRPQKIEELDNQTVRESLFSIFSKGSFPHAFLFTGPKGLGKTSTARIVAKVINCEKHKGEKLSKAKSAYGGAIKTEKEIEPDNKCPQCVSITNGNNLDVLEIDGASNRGIDEIRDLREKIKLAPFKASKKVYIIDEVHMLTTEAFNALLKTLEEPPAHAVFILCTTEPHKVPATIASRCFRVNFTRATEDELVRSLTRIVKAEGIKIDKEALVEIGRLADGSFRDATKILEEVGTFAGRKTITKELVNGKYNTLGIGENINALLEALAEKNSKKGINIVHELAKQGMDFKFFIEELINQLHLHLLFEVGVEKTKTKDYGFSVGDIQKLFELLSTAYQETKFSVLPQMPLELAILEWANVDWSGGLPHVTGDAQQSRSESTDITPSLSERRQTKSDEDVKENSKSSFSSPVNGQPSSPNKVFLNDLIEEVKAHNPLVAGLLRSCSAEDVKNGKLNIVASSKFHKEKLEEQKAMKLLGESTNKILGKETEVKIILKSRGGESE